MKISFLLILFSILLAGCKFEAAINPNELTEPLIVENAAVGWKIEVPAGWVISSETEAQEFNERGLQKIEETIDREINAPDLINLLNIQKYEVNTFAVTAEPFFEEYINEWKITHEIWNQILIATYADQGMTAEISPITTVDINGVEFTTYSYEISNTKNDNLIKQQIYSSLYNGFDFCASMTYVENGVMEEMLTILKTSEFEIREMPDSLIAHYVKMEKEFTAAIVLGDQAFDQLKYGEAMFWYEKAYNLNPLEQYAEDKFEECQRLADDTSDTEYQVLQSYQKIVDKADSLFNEKDYRAALGYYERAIGFKPEFSYPKEKIILIKDTILKMDYPEDWKPA